MTESKISIHDLAVIREAILTVIDDGPFKSGKSKDPKDDIWDFYGGGFPPTTEDEANAARLDFCDAVQALVVERLKIKEQS